jgi:hypothetical protein
LFINVLAQEERVKLQTHPPRYDDDDDDDIIIVVVTDLLTPMNVKIFFVWVPIGVVW